MSVGAGRGPGAEEASGEKIPRGDRRREGRPVSQWGLGLWRPGVRCHTQLSGAMDGLVSLFMPRNLSYISGLYEHARLADDFGVSAAGQGQDPGHGGQGEAAEHDSARPRGRKQLRSEDLSASALVIREPHDPSDAFAPPPFAPTPIVRRRAKSLPSVPGRPAPPEPPCSRRKSVRFSDSLGLELTVVRHFSSSEEPRVPPHVLESLHRGALARFARLDAWDGAGGCCGRCGPGGQGAGGGGGGRRGGGGAAGLSASEPLRRSRLEAAFAQPLGDPEFASRLRAQLVRLESVAPGELSVTGHVRVLNVAFEKEVSVRFSYDAWRTHAEARARFAPPGLAEPNPAPGTDRFAFALPTPPFLQPGGALELAVRYRVAGREHWDNNGGANYRLEVRSERPGPPRELDRSWIHFV
uniref:LOW QUALITY PROTEIN: protein phosphatase 1 regulatory subunit 3E-like n=1 Tax=Petromyzon marinus TaxID=7757 RepID=A0AAJ7WZQ3_PETMA|nr:LOW QUALITY PROTEIN: protein phosphatase 1 regulatory subunit 3E-like [Petromyzon marinus]